MNLTKRVQSGWGRKLASLLCAVALAAAVSAEVSCSFKGATMNVAAPSTHKDCRLVLLWDKKDKGDDPAAWANAHEIAAVVPAAGARYSIDLANLGIANGTPCRIAVYERYRLLDKLQMTSKQCYIDTGFKDTEVYGVRFGFYGNSGAAASWNFIIGSGEGDTSARGFVVGENSANYASWYWTYTGFRAEGSDRASVYTDTINEAAFTNSMFTLNGRVVKSGLTAGPVGALDISMCIGTAKNNNSDARYHYGWWSHVSFYDANGNALLDYIPVQRSDGVVGFWDRVTDKLVTSTGGGAFTAGTVTNEGFEVACSMQRVTPNHMMSAEISGSKLYARVPAGLAGEQLMLAWGDGDKGGDIDDWPNSAEVAPVIGKDGGMFVADLARLGVRNGQTCRVFARHNLQLLDMLHMPDTNTFVNTGIQDGVCYGVRFGFYGTGKSANFGNIIGTDDGGFTVGANSDAITSWYWCYRGVKSSPRPTVKTDSINDVAFTNRTFTLNGSVVKSGLAAGAVGELGKEMYVGRYAAGRRFQYGWWSYVRFDDADGNAILDYVPVRLADGTVGFYDRVTSSFVANTGNGSFVAGTVTNTCVTAANSTAVIVAHSIPALDVSVTGTELTVTAPAGLAGEQLLLLWDVTDKGDDIAAWANSETLAASLPAQGGTYSANFAALGIGREHVCRVVSANQVSLLDMLGMPNTSTYVDTGIPDSRCYGVRLGFYGNEGYTSNNGTFQLFIGTIENVDEKTPSGFAVGMNNANFTSWYFIYRDYKSGERPTVSTDSINDVAFANRTFTLNGTVVKSGLGAGAVGESGRNMYIGTYALINRFLYGWWSYARFDDAGGNAIIDYVPAQRATDGKVGFLDRASGTFVLSTGGGDFTAGTETNASFSACHLWRSVSLADIVATATWTGLGTAGALDDPANWACTNLYGEEVSGLPNEFTDVTIPAADDFSCPEGSVFSCQTISVGGTLAGNRDWRGLDFARVVGTIDLAGHALQAVARADMSHAMTVTDTIGGGTLCLEVPDTAVVSNTAVAMTGAMKFVKEGDGRFVAAKTGQTYSGGTDVVGGTFACGSHGTAGVYGAAGGTNTVCAGAAFDCNGFDEHWQNPFVLAGGTLRNPKRVAHVTLTADSFIVASGSTTALANEDYAETTLEMNGQTLAFDIAAGQMCALVNLTVTGGGTILGRSGGYLRMGYTGAAGVRAAGTVLDIRHSLRVDAETTFLDYISRYVLGGYDTGATNPIKVVRRFCPCGDNMRWHSVELQDGAILDLSKVTGTWEATSQGDHFDGTSTLTFAPGATITVDVGERTPALNDQLTSWTAKPQDVTFVWDSELPLCALRAGLFVKTDPGMAIILR